MSFRIGRAYAKHTYPESRGSGASAGAFARNFATGPSSTVDILSTGTALPWTAIDVGGSGTEVPITPENTGVLRISGVICVKNSSGVDTVDATVTILVNDVTIPLPEFDKASVTPNGFESIPFLAEVTGLTVGVGATVSIVVFASADGALHFGVSSSSIEVQEVSVATG